MWIPHKTKSGPTKTFMGPLESFFQKHLFSKKSQNNEFLFLRNTTVTPTIKKYFDIFLNFGEIKFGA